VVGVDSSYQIRVAVEAAARGRVMPNAQMAIGTWTAECTKLPGASVQPGGGNWVSASVTAR
jgi:hypothetical protein